MAIYLFLGQYSQASLKDVQAIEEASPQKRTSSTSKNEIYYLFPILCVIFALLDPDCESGSGSGSRDPLEFGRMRNTD